MQTSKRLGLTGGLLLVCACSAPVPAPEGPAAGEPVLSIATFNINFGLAGDPETVAAVPDADVVLLQETTPAWERALQSDPRPYRAFRHCCLAGGLGILSRYPFRETAYIEPPEGGWFPGWVLIAETPLGKIQLLDVHLRPPRSETGSLVSGFFTTPPVRRGQIELYASYLDPLLPTIVAGDFNEEPGGVALSYLQGRGFQDALRIMDDQSPTWRWNTAVGEVTAQLDHILVDRRFRVFDASVVHEGQSDHLPVLARIARRRPSR